ncbi:MAG: twin-arginine translocation signal domain-containing protein [Methyloceanibacter sp.]|jgi:carbonic anhydrase|nr:twin-arginine translocation signal domain-containing protein [Methyloceanibacter sp.]
MCINCKGDGIGRRDVLRLSAAGLVAIGLGGAPWSSRAQGILKA